jgi:hypothetical protein
VWRPRGDWSLKKVTWFHSKSLRGKNSNCSS